VAFAKPERISTVIARTVIARITNVDLPILGLNPFSMLTRMQKQYKIVIVKENAKFSIPAKHK
jgi:hypothetical protein